MSDIGDRINDLALNVECPFCGAKPDEWCRTRRTGVEYRYLHGRRTTPFWQAFWMGQDQGQADVLDDLIDGKQELVKRQMQQRRKTREDERTAA